MYSYSRDLFCQAISATTSRGPDAGSAYPVTKALRWDDLFPGPLPSWGKEMESGNQVVKSYLPTSNVDG
jgi:hypothetical protein